MSKDNPFSRFPTGFSNTSKLSSNGNDCSSCGKKNRKFTKSCMHCGSLMAQIEAQVKTYPEAELPVEREEELSVGSAEEQTLELEELLLEEPAEQLPQEAEEVLTEEHEEELSEEPEAVIISELEEDLPETSEEELTEESEEELPEEHEEQTLEFEEVLPEEFEEQLALEAEEVLTKEREEGLPEEPEAVIISEPEEDLPEAAEEELTEESEEELPEEHEEQTLEFEEVLPEEFEEQLALEAEEVLTKEREEGLPEEPEAVIISEPEEDLPEAAEEELTEESEEELPEEHEEQTLEFEEVLPEESEEQLALEAEEVLTEEREKEETVEIEEELFVEEFFNPKDRLPEELNLFLPEKDHSGQKEPVWKNLPGLRAALPWQRKISGAFYIFMAALLLLAVIKGDFATCLLIIGLTFFVLGGTGVIFSIIKKDAFRPFALFLVLAFVFMFLGDVLQPAAEEIDIKDLPSEDVEQLQEEEEDKMPDQLEEKESNLPSFYFGDRMTVFKEELDSCYDDWSLELVTPILYIKASLPGNYMDYSNDDTLAEVAMEEALKIADLFVESGPRHVVPEINNVEITITYPADHELNGDNIIKFSISK